MLAVLKTALVALSLSAYTLALPADGAAPAGGAAPAVTAAPTTSWTTDTVFEPGTPVPTKAVLGECVDRAAGLLGIKMDLQTDPAVLKEVLDTDMHIIDFKGLKDAFDASEIDTAKMAADKVPIALKARSLRSMLERVKKGLVEQHPAIGVALCVALNSDTSKGIFTKADTKQLIRTLHHMYVLDKLVVRCVNNIQFMKDVYTHMRAKMDEKSPNKGTFFGHLYDLWKAAGVFGAVKDFSINMGIEGFMEIRDSGVVDAQRLTNHVRGIAVNIAEATTTDLSSKHFSNGRVGELLAQYHPKSLKLVGDNRDIVYGLTLDWARIYEAWNLAFVTGNLDFPNILYPKLLIPEVILATGEGYLFRRVVALWLSIQWYVLSDMYKVPHMRYEGQEAIATIMGRVNLRYVKWLGADKHDI